MPYSGPHKLLTFGGGLFTGPVDTWSCGLRFSGAALPTQAMADSCATIVNAWWKSTVSHMSIQHTLDFVKVAPIQADGHYPPAAIAYNGTLTGDRHGGDSTGTQPPQVCIVISTTTDIPRGRAHIGRMYLPGPGISLTAQGGIDAASAGDMLSTVKTMINGLNAVTDMGSATVMSFFGNQNTITGLRCGLVLDTQRRRRAQIPESYQLLAL